MATLDNWLHLLGNTPQTITFSHLSLDSGRDGDDSVFEGCGEVVISTASQFEFTLRGRPTDLETALRKLRCAQENPYDAQEQFKLSGVDTDGVHWMLGWTQPTVQDFDHKEWKLTGEINELTCVQSEPLQTISSVENIFEIPRHTAMAQTMERMVRTPQILGVSPIRERTLDILDTHIFFAYDSAKGYLTIRAQTSDAFQHPYAENWLAEPLRIMFGQLIYPRLVARNFEDSRTIISLRRSPGFVRDASLAPLWAAARQGSIDDLQIFWELYGRLLTHIALSRDKSGHPNFESNPLTRFYEELIQSSRGSRWVWALSLASIVEGQARMLIYPGEQRNDVNETAIADLCKHIGEWKGDGNIKGHATHVVKQIREMTPTRLLARLRNAGVVTANQVTSWKEIRNAVMHGKLICPWSTENEDQKILDLANLMHALSLQIIRSSVDPRSTDLPHL